MGETSRPSGQTGFGAPIATVGDIRSRCAWSGMPSGVEVFTVAPNSVVRWILP